MPKASKFQFITWDNVQSSLLRRLGRVGGSGPGHIDGDHFDVFDPQQSIFDI